MEPERSGMRVPILLCAVVAIVLVAIFLSGKIGQTAVGISNMAYDQHCVGQLAALGGELVGTGRDKLAASGGNQYVHWVDVKVNGRVVRCYMKEKLLRKEAPVVAEGIINARGRLQVTRFSFLTEP